MLISLLVATVVAILVLYANRALNPEPTIKNIIHVGVIIVWCLVVLDLFTGRHLLGRFG